jgi:hypothetical protein
MDPSFRWDDGRWVENPSEGPVRYRSRVEFSSVQKQGLIKAMIALD